MKRAGLWPRLEGAIGHLVVATVDLCASGRAKQHGIEAFVRLSRRGGCASAGRGFATRFWPQPIPQISCSEPLFEAKVAESVAVGQWAHTNALHLAAGGLFLTFALFYFQIFHWLTAKWAPFVATLLALAVAWSATVLTNYWWVQQAQRWAERQTPSCLEEALADSSSASYAAWSGELLRRLPGLDSPDWTSLLMADAAALAAIAVARRLADVPARSTRDPILEATTMDVLLAAGGTGQEVAAGVLRLCYLTGRHDS